MFLKNMIEPLLETARSENDTTLDDEDFNKIRNYYGFGVPAIVGEGICTLRGRPMNHKERLANTFQGALTGLYDDFFDKTGLQPEGIKKMMENPEGYAPSTSLEKLFINFLIKVHENIVNKEIFNDSFDMVFTAQMNSKKQESDSLLLEELKDITFQKGAYSILFYRSVFQHKLQDGEEDALYHAGALMQLGNDIFDVYDDENEKIKTLVTECGQIDSVRQLFLSQLELCIKLFRESSFGKRNIEAYLNKFVLGLSRCFVCLDQLERLQRKTDGKFNPDEYSRAEMICDMEKPGNMLSSLRYFTSYKF